MTTRDEFKKPVTLLLASRAGHHCSNPDCRRETSGPDATAGGSVNIGVAAHITAAAPGGPRFDAQLSPAERSAAANGVWLCQSCAKLIDDDETRFTKVLLLGWKSAAEAQAQSLLQTPRRPQHAEEPILDLPSADPSVSLLPFSARASAFVGHDVMRAELGAFLRSQKKFSWWLLTGAAGTGKSRLALELCLGIRPGWTAGFLSRADEFKRWSYFRPSRATLIIVDYVAGRAADASAMVLQLSRSMAYFPHPVRVLLLERDEGSWWPRFLREDSQNESAELANCQHGTPLRLGPLSTQDLSSVAADVARLRKTPWTDSTRRAFEARMRTLDPLGRPLFAMIAAAFPAGETGDAVVDSAVLRIVLTREAARRRLALPDAEHLQRMENLITLATMVGGLLPRGGGFTFLSDTAIDTLVPDPNFLDQCVYRDLVAATSSEAILAGLQPDILGERFVLDRVTGGGGAGHSAKRLLAAAWTLQPDDVSDFIIRTASDFPGDAGLDVLCDLPLESPEARGRWGRLVGDVVRVVDRSQDERTQRLIGSLRELARGHAAEVEVQRALACAEFYLGNIFLLSEHDYPRAASQFEAAIALAGPGSEIAAMAINNRGILHHEIQDEETAFADWCDVIATEGASDEARACALNNRADVYARRGAHADAIRDRSSVLALQDTSFNRRYIALKRRSASYVEVGRTEDALEDLDRILRTEDITPEQKANARVARGALRRDHGRLEEARGDLEAVLAAEEVFPGTHASALAELGELARLEGDRARAREYLESAATSPDVQDDTLVEIMLVRGRLLVDEGNTAAADSIWQSVLANPNAGPRHKSIAERRGIASAPPAPQ